MPLRQGLSNRNKPRKFSLSKDSRNWPDPLDTHTVSLAEEGKPMQTTPMWKTSGPMVLITALIVVVLASCASYSYEVVRPYDNRWQHILEPGDTVMIVTKDGRDLTFEINTITGEAVTGRHFWAFGGKEKRVLFSEIATLKRRVSEEDSGIVRILMSVPY